MSRYFFALWPGNSIREAILNRASRLDLTGSKTIESNLHLTLLYMGILPTKQLEEIINRARLIDCPEFEMCLNHSGYFKPSKASWLGLESVPTTLLQLHSQLLEIAGQCSINVIPQQFKPHVTLSRKSSRFTNQFIRPILWQVNDFVLIESIDTATGVKYQPVEYFRLTN